MKVGNLVRHPKGIINVCEKQYSAGIVLQVTTHPHPTGSITQCLVLWCGLIGPMQYQVDQLEVISESL